MRGMQPMFPPTFANKVQNEMDFDMDPKTSM